VFFVASSVGIAKADFTNGLLAKWTFSTGTPSDLTSDNGEFTLVEGGTGSGMTTTYNRDGTISLGAGRELLCTTLNSAAYPELRTNITIWAKMRYDTAPGSSQLHNFGLMGTLPALAFSQFHNFSSGETLGGYVSDGRTATNSFSITSGLPTPATGQFANYAVVFQKTDASHYTFKLNLNGTELTASASVGTAPSTMDSFIAFALGRLQSSVGVGLTFDEVRVYDEGLTADKIAQIGVSTPGPTTIMLIGDSLTQGFTYDPITYGYVGFRYPLFYDLQALGYSFHFVGSQNALHGNLTPFPNLYPLYYTGFGTNHEGHSGYRTDQIINDGQGFTIASSAYAYMPDVATILLGGNDLRQNYPVSTVLTNLGTIIDTLRAANPYVKILLSDLIPVGPQDPLSPMVPGWNLSVSNYALIKTTGASPVAFVDLFAGYNVTADTQSDGTHPIQYGEQLMADRFAIGLQKFMSPGSPVKSPAIHLGNAGFEGLSVGDNSLASTPAEQGWIFSSTGSEDAGIFNPGTADYPGSSGTNSPIGGEGANVAYTYNKQALLTGADFATIQQTVGAFLEAHALLNVKVAIGQRLAGDSYQSTYGGYNVELLAGNTIIGSDSNTITPAAGTFADASFSVVSDALDPSLLGQPLSIVLMQTSKAQFAATDFDNVRFTSTPGATLHSPFLKGPGVIGFAMDCASGFNYQIQVSTNLAPSNVWTTILTTNTTQNTVIIYDNQATNSQRFYRAVGPVAF
jgi:lysophospholipase L1-like esterase